MFYFSVEKLPASQMQVIVEVLEAVDILLYSASKFLCAVICTHMHSVFVSSEMMTDHIFLIWFVITLRLKQWLKIVN